MVTSASNYNSTVDPVITSAERLTSMPSLLESLRQHVSGASLLETRDTLKSRSQHFPRKQIKEDKMTGKVVHIPCQVPVASFPSRIGIVTDAPTSADLM